MTRPLSGRSRRAAMLLGGALAASCVAITIGYLARHDGPAAKLSAPPVAPKSVTPAVVPIRYEPLPPLDARMVNAALPIASSAGPAALPFPAIGTVGSTARAQDCLAAAAFFEAGRDEAGERAVAQVILNRVRHPAFPKTVCGVVFQGAERRTGCQFTFTCDGAMGRYSPSPAAWRRAQAVAAAALAGSVYAPVGLATHYHADWVVPYWSAKLDKIAQVGTHIFYRWAGWWGTPDAYRARESGVEPSVALLAGLSQVHGEGASAMLAGDGPSARPVRRILSTPSDPDLFLVRLETGGGASYPAQAQTLCMNRGQCTVFGWTNPRLVARSLPLTPEQMDGLAFRYVRTGDAASATMLWDCIRTPRPDPSQCMRVGLLSAAPPVQSDRTAG